MVEQLRRSEFLVTQRGVYLDHATFGPLPASNIRAAAAMLDSLANPDAEGLGGTQLLESVRFQAAIMLHCDPGRVALLKSTSEGWPAGARPRLARRRRGDRLRAGFLGVSCRRFSGSRGHRRMRPHCSPTLSAARFDLDDLERLLTPPTRAVCRSVVNRAHRHARSGRGDRRRLPRDRGLWYALDAAQALGGPRPGSTRPISTQTSSPRTATSSSPPDSALRPPIARSGRLAELRVPQVGWKNTRLAATEPNGELELPERRALRVHDALAADTRRHARVAPPP